MFTMTQTAGYKTLKEILDQPATWKRTVERFNGDLGNSVEWIREKAPATILFTGCGTSYYLSLAAAAAFRAMAGQPAQGVPGSEVFLQPETTLPAGDDSLVIGVSRSGESSETVMALSYVKENRRGTSAALSCYPGSSITRQAEKVWTIPEAQEESVVMTKSFSSLLLFLDLVAAALGQQRGILDELASLPQIGQQVIAGYEQMMATLASDPKTGRFVFLGSGSFYGLALEAMLKVKEQAVAWSEAYHSLEVRHGPKSIVDDNTLVVAFVSPSAWRFEADVLKEMMDYGAKVLTLGAEDAVSEWNVVLPQGVNAFARGLAAMPLVQLLGYYHAIAKKLDPDVPQHLTQVVRL
jgi:glucosamine--fructose-6-phosphate aminotransferase (isomerizing)